MQIKSNGQGYVTDYAIIGNVENGIEVKEPNDLYHFETHFQSYRVRDGTLEYDEQKSVENEQKALCDELRKRRETECFSYVNRGQPWYDRLTDKQKSELQAWYDGWLKVTETLTAPQKAVLVILKKQRRTTAMKEFWTTIQVIFAAVGGWLGWFLGGCDGLLYALLAFVALDYITGVMCAVVDKKLSSEIGFKDIFKKVLIFALVGIDHILDTQVLGSGSVLRIAVIFFYLSNEGVSLIENAGHFGLPIPKKLKAVLEQLHDRAEKEENSNDDEY